MWSSKMPLTLALNAACLSQSGLHKFEDRTPCCFEADDLAIEEVHDRREIELLARQTLRPIAPDCVR